MMNNHPTVITVQMINPMKDPNASSNLSLMISMPSIRTVFEITKMPENKSLNLLKNLIKM